MNKKTKKSLIEWAILITAAAVIYLGGWHTELIGKVQQGVLFSGLFKPDTGEELIKSREADFNLKLRNQEGEIIDMNELKGKVIFLNLWATWCPPCIAEMPGIDALYNEVKDEEVVFLMISLDENFAKAKRFKDRKNYSFDVFELAGQLPDMYHSQSIPTTYVISAEGKLVFSHKGMADYNTPRFKKFLLEQQ